MNPVIVVILYILAGQAEPAVNLIPGFIRAEGCAAVQSTYAESGPREYNGRPVIQAFVNCVPVTPEDMNIFSVTTRMFATP